MIGTNFRISERWGVIYAKSSIGALSNGGFVFCWESDEFGTFLDIRAQVFDNDGNHICDGILSASGEHLSAGDTITFSCPPLVHGEAYLVRAICPEGQVGKAEYIA